MAVIKLTADAWYDPQIGLVVAAGQCSSQGGAAVNEPVYVSGSWGQSTHTRTTFFGKFECSLEPPRPDVKNPTVTCESGTAKRTVPVRNLPQ